MKYKINNYTSKLEFFSDIQQAYKKLNIKNLAISGGSSLNIFDTISPNLDTDIYLVDERFVPEDNPSSNYLQAKNKIKADIKSWQVAKHNDISLCLTQYERSLPCSFDLMILGVGTDGHTASLFPNTKALYATSLCTHNQTDKFDIKDRLTLTFQAIKKAKKVFVILIDKPNVIKKIKDDTIEYEDFPIKKVLQLCDTVLYHLNTKENI